MWFPRLSQNRKAANMAINFPNRSRSRSYDATRCVRSRPGKQPFVYRIVDSEFVAAMRHAARPAAC
jgi:hypothetical protein